MHKISNLKQNLSGFEKFIDSISRDDFMQMYEDYNSGKFSSKIEEEINKILLPHGVSPGIAISYGDIDTYHSQFKGTDGNRNKLDEDTLFDLASVTKLFLGILYMYLAETGRISFENPIGEYTGKYKNISNILVKDLLSYNVNLKTSKRIDLCNDCNEAELLLWDISGEYSDIQIYSDMPAMILADILSDATGKSFRDWICTLFVENLKLSNMVWQRDEQKKYVSYQNEYIITNQVFFKKDNPIGIVNDPKARIFMERKDYLCGNAGLFCSTKEISKVCQSILSEKIISRDSIKKMVKGSGWNCSSSKQSYGYMCYRKYFDRRQSEIPFFMSSYALASSGYTGCYLMMDIINGIYAFIGGNRLNNCVSKNTTDFKEKDGYFEMENKRIKSGLHYVYDRDRLRDLVCYKALFDSM